MTFRSVEGFEVPSASSDSESTDSEAELAEAGPPTE